VADQPKRLELRDRLQEALGSGYAIERELGGGGMSRVFVAVERAFDRRVVVKVLPPEMLHSLSFERFRREIQLAAGLQHPHIVPVHNAGDTGGLPYYTMPFVEGTSLRDRIAESGPLGFNETVSILRDVAKALAYAHERGIVHRDIKPANVLLTGGTAVVADFGIAKALSASRTEQQGEDTLTSAGIRIGTPAYMAPEQAAADPEIDGRADIYSLGCMAYEMLAGAPPFVASSPHRVLAAHMGDTPRPIGGVRGDVPASLAALVMQCLEKDPDARPQSALQLVRELEVATTANSGRAAIPVHRTTLTRALTVYGVAALTTVLVARAAVTGIGLPLWVMSAAYALLALGIPIVLLTVGMQPRTDITRPVLTWRRTTRLGVAAAAVLVLAVTGYMAMRLLGIGPAATLLAQGSLTANERVVVADFSSPPGDTTIGPLVTEAFRSDLSQSDAITVVQPNQVQAVLRRMRIAQDTALRYELARQIAAREGIKAVIDGKVIAVAGGYVLNATLHNAQTGDVLATFRASADDPDALLSAIGALSRSVRAKIGESLRNVNSAPAIEQVTTSSLEAYRKYVAAVRIIKDKGDTKAGVELLEEAIALDTGFAMAYRRLALALLNEGVDEKRARAAIERAYAHRDRLTDAERYLTLGTYYTFGPRPDRQRALEAYSSLMQLSPNAVPAYANSAALHTELRQYRSAEDMARRGLGIDSTNNMLYGLQFSAQVSQGKLKEAKETVVAWKSKAPNSTLFADAASFTLAWNQRDFDGLEKMVRAQLAAEPSRAARSNNYFLLVAIARLRGQVRQSSRLMMEQRRGLQQRDDPLNNLLDAVDESRVQSTLLGWRDVALRMLDSALRQFPLDSIAPERRPYYEMVRAFAAAGAIAQAKEHLAQFDATRRLQPQMSDVTSRPNMQAHIAMAERRYDDAIAAYREGDLLACPICSVDWLARAYESGGYADSAVALFTRYVDLQSDPDRYWHDSFHLAEAYEHLAKLLEAKGDRSGAATRYASFIELWKNADPELQPRVTEARERLANLQAARQRQ
jgi:eukaryotic-like serine/threonine-protein kinase